MTGRKEDRKEGGVKEGKEEEGRSEKERGRGMKKGC